MKWEKVGFRYRLKCKRGHWKSIRKSGAPDGTGKFLAPRFHCNVCHCWNVKLHRSGLSIRKVGGR